MTQANFVVNSAFCMWQIRVDDDGTFFPDAAAPRGLYRRRECPALLRQRYRRGIGVGVGSLCVLVVEIFILGYITKPAQGTNAYSKIVVSLLKFNTI